ncbi:diguanylate cyclase [Haloimpatiens sp. FM7315]|uniref:GGDEF domain-containing protein n=1 Tax=Haloimpatiens sp. FM7315 TaxID=3298609 RepID=UPI0035A2BF6A
MNKILYDILDTIDEGIILLNEDLKILFWNNYMESLTNTKEKEVLDSDIFETIPSFNKGYIKETIDSVIKDGRKIFFSAAMHKDLLDNNSKNLNLKISRIRKDNSNFILIEFINVTNEFLRINQLKMYIDELYYLNKKLKVKEKIINKLAYYDELTGLANRALFHKMAKELCQNEKSNTSPLGLLFIDVDNFKYINDTYGHEKGDKVLKSIAKILTKSSRKKDVVSRFGGDEFLILMPFLDDATECRNVASEIIKNINLTFNSISDVKVSLSIGVSVFENCKDCIDKLLLKADKAMYKTKNQGGNGYYFL